jgi:non-lysosomal glucosylceramidase
MGACAVGLPQPNTYDCALYGVNTFVGALYLCALRASEEMANLTGDSTLAATYHARFEVGSAALDAACFVNGKWYTQVVDPAHPVNELSTGTFVDQLLGQWWAHILGLGYLLPQAHVATSVQVRARARLCVHVHVYVHVCVCVCACCVELVCLHVLCPRT